MNICNFTMEQMSGVQSQCRKGSNNKEPNLANRPGATVYVSVAELWCTKMVPVLLLTKRAPRTAPLKTAVLPLNIWALITWKMGQFDTEVALCGDIANVLVLPVRIRPPRSYSKYSRSTGSSTVCYCTRKICYFFSIVLKTWTCQKDTDSHICKKCITQSHLPLILCLGTFFCRPLGYRYYLLVSNSEKHLNLLYNLRDLL